MYEQPIQFLLINMELVSLDLLHHITLNNSMH